MTIYFGRPFLEFRKHCSLPCFCFPWSEVRQGLSQSRTVFKGQKQVLDEAAKSDPEGSVPCWGLLVPLYSCEVCCGCPERSELPGTGACWQGACDTGCGYREGFPSILSVPGELCRGGQPKPRVWMVWEVTRILFAVLAGTQQWIIPVAAESSVSCVDWRNLCTEGWGGRNAACLGYSTCNP